jgi:hypothetical protein
MNPELEWYGWWADGNGGTDGAVAEARLQAYPTPTKPASIPNLFSFSLQVHKLKG